MREPSVFAEGLDIALRSLLKVADSLNARTPREQTVAPAVRGLV